MMVKKLQLFLVLLIMSLVFVGCGQNKVNQTNESTTVYIGDNSKVAAIANQLPYPKGVSYHSIEILSKKEPYELKVFLDSDSEDIAGLQKCADKAFEQISNMGIISFYEKDSGMLIKSYKRK